jgi:hypothetical protein
MRLAMWLLLCLTAGVLARADPAVGHDPLGRAQPVPATTVLGSGFTRSLRIQLTDSDSGRPVTGARVGVVASGGPRAGSRVVGLVRELRPGLFISRLRLPTTGHWVVNVRIGGKSVVPISFSVGVDVGRVADPRAGHAENLWLLVGVPVSAAVLAVAIAVGWWLRGGVRRQSHRS